MFHKIILAILCLFALEAGAKSNISGISIGTKYPPYPAGCERGGGWLAGADDAGVQLAMSFLKCGDTTYLSLGRFTHRDENKNPHWEVIDFVAIPALKNGESIGEDFDCTYEVDGTTGVITVGTWRETPEKSYATNISFAVRFNQKTLKIEKLNPNQVKCEYFEDRN